MSDVKDWAVSAGGDTTASPDGFPEGMAPSGVNDAAREVMAAAARDVRLVRPFRTATATTNTNVSYMVENADISVGAVYQGMILSCLAPMGNTGTANLQIAGVASTKFPIKFGGAHLSSSSILTNQVITAAYNAAGQSWDLLSPIAGLGSGSLVSLTNSLGANVALNNTAAYFTGPTVAQGTTGTWFASGTVTLTDNTGAAQFYVKLWDGTTVIASAVAASYTAGAAISIGVSGYLASPAGNIRISVRDTSSTNGFLIFNGSGNSKDCTLSVVRIA